MPRDVTQFRERLFHYAYRKTRIVHVAEDVVQEAFSRWYQHDRSSVDAPYAWLMSVVNHLCVDHWRHIARETSTDSFPFASDGADPGSGIERWCDVVDALSLAVYSLNPEQRVAIVLRDVFGWSYIELGATLNKSTAACRQIVHRARVTLEQSRSEYGPGVHEGIAAQFIRAVREEDAMAALNLMSSVHAAA